MRGESKPATSENNQFTKEDNKREKEKQRNYKTSTSRKQ